jgi:DNA-binding MarR family transcriptional regulator
VQATATVTDKGKAGLDDREAAVRLGALLQRIWIGDSAKFLGALEESGLTLTQCKALSLLAGADEPGPGSVKDLGDRLGVSLPTISRATESLVRKGLVTRDEDSSDRRVRRIAITKDGRRLVEELLAIRIAGLEGFISGLDAGQRRKLHGALEAILDETEIAAFRAIARRTGGRR